MANDLYDALQQFFLLFPQLQKNDFYATGESYAGKYVPAISYKVQVSVKRVAPGLVNFTPAVASNFCLNLTAAFT